MENSVLTSWHQILQTKDLNKLSTILHDDVVFHSPVVHTPQVGKQVTLHYLGAAFKVFFDDSFTYLREVTGANDAILEFTVEIDGIAVNGVDMIKWNDEHKIIEFKVMIRPLKAINIIHQKMGELLMGLKK
jgi:hypothetical protein